MVILKCSTFHIIPKYALALEAQMRFSSDISSGEEQSLLIPWTLKYYSLSARHELLIHDGEELTAAHSLQYINYYLLKLNTIPAEAQGQLHINAKNNPQTHSKQV